MPIYPQGPPRSSNTGMIIALVGGGAFAIILVIAIILVVVRTSGEDDSPTDRLTAAADRLAGVPGLSLRGSITASTDRLEGELKVTRGGWLTGDVSWNGKSVQVFAAGDDVYAKGDVGFWQAEANLSDRPAWVDRSRWGRLSYSSLSSSLGRDLTPSAIARDMRSVSRYSIDSTEQTTVQGIAALKISTGSDTYFVAADGSSRLLRIETTYPRTSADVTELGGDTATSELRERINQLKGSFDPSRSSRVDKITWGSCTTSGCTVHAKVWSTKGSAPSIRVTVFVRITTEKDSGRKLGECSNSGTVTSYDSIDVSCRVTGAAWTKFRGGSGYRRWWGHAEAMPNGATDTEIQTMLSGLGGQ